MSVETTKAKFQLEDRIRLRDGVYAGDCGTIKAVHNQPGKPVSYGIKFDDDMIGAFLETQIEDVNHPDKTEKNCK